MAKKARKAAGKKPGRKAEEVRPAAAQRGPDPDAVVDAVQDKAPPRSGMENNPLCPYCGVRCIGNGTKGVNGVARVIRYYRCPHRNDGCRGKYTTHVIDGQRMSLAMSEDNEPQADFSAR